MQRDEEMQRDAQMWKNMIKGMKRDKGNEERLTDMKGDEGSLS